MYFFDTYTVIELMEGNPAYSQFITAPFVFAKLNLIELHYHSLRKFGPDKARLILDKYSKNVVDFDDNTIIDANELRRRIAKRNVSTADCIGYVYAKRNAIRFVTGDKEFKNLENVEFVK